MSLVFLNLWSKLQTLREDGFADMRGKYEKSEGRALTGPSAPEGHRCVASCGLLDGRFRWHVTQRLVVDLVEVTPNEPKLLVDEDVI